MGRLDEALKDGGQCCESRDEFTLFRGQGPVVEAEGNQSDHVVREQPEVVPCVNYTPVDFRSSIPPGTQPLCNLSRPARGGYGRADGQEFATGDK